jgi:hypothetical protein
MITFKNNRIPMTNFKKIPAPTRDVQIPDASPRSGKTPESSMRDLEAKVAYLLEIVEGRSFCNHPGPAHKIQTDSQEYTSLLYQQMERGLFPKQAELATVITKSVKE